MLNIKINKKNQSINQSKNIQQISYQCTLKCPWLSEVFVDYMEGKLAWLPRMNYHVQIKG